MTYATSVQLVDQSDLERLKVMAALNHKPIGEYLSTLVDTELDRFTLSQIRKALKNQSDLLKVIEDKTK